MEKIHVVFPGMEYEHPARRVRRKPDEILRIDIEREKLAEVAFRELAKSCGGSSPRLSPSGGDYYSNFSNHGEVRGQEVRREERNGARLWRRHTHIGGRKQFCCEMEVPNADEAMHRARLGMRVILLDPQRPEGARLLPPRIC